MAAAAGRRKRLRVCSPDALPAAANARSFAHPTHCPSPTRARPLAGCSAHRRLHPLVRAPDA